MKLQDDLSQDELVARADAAAEDGEPTTFREFVSLVETAATLTGCPGFAVITMHPRGLAVFAGGVDVEAAKLCADMARRVGCAMAMRLEETKGETGLPT